MKRAPMNAITQYINDALEELRHVRWPTRNQAIRLSTVVVVFTIAFSAVFGLIDFVLSEGLKQVLSVVS